MAGAYISDLVLGEYFDMLRGASVDEISKAQLARYVQAPGEQESIPCCCH